MKFTFLTGLCLLIFNTAFEQNKTSWLLKGNANTDAAINFIGTIDTVPLIFKVKGQFAGFLDFSYKGNIAFGYQSQQIKKSFYNSAFGYQVLHTNSADNNTGIGYRALYKNTIGSYNTAVGSGALYNTTQGFSNTAIGHQTLYFNDRGIYNVAIGDGALYGNVSGRYNTAIGAATLLTNTADNNVAIGYYAMYYNTTGTNNTSVGISSLQLNTTGSNNTAVGLNALDFNKLASGNTAFGSYALASLVPGGNNTAIGFNANISDGGLKNTVVIGANAVVDNDNMVRIGNNYITSIGGQVEWTSFSDKRIKQNIKEDVPGLLFINKLRPITYAIDVKAANFLRGTHDSVDADEKGNIEKIKFTGFIAQEVDEAANKIGYEFSGVDKSGKLMGLRYSSFVVPLVKAVQELNISSAKKDSAIQDLQSEITTLKAEISDLKKIILSAGSVNGNQQLSNKNNAVLFQNIPNPFTASSTIKFILPQTYAVAYIIITNKTGDVVRKINLTVNGSGSININRLNISAGIYQYSLYVDNKLIDTKQMIAAN